MTREEKQKAIDVLKISAPVMAVTQEEFSDYIQTLNKIMDWLEQEPREDATLKDIFCMGCEYKEQELTTKNNLGVDCIPRVKVIDYLCKHCPDDGECFEDCDEIKHLRKMPSVTLQEPRKGHCKDCKWWKDKDGVYRRGVGAESKCPINRREVMEGRGYCFMFEPQESGDKE